MKSTINKLSEAFADIDEQQRMTNNKGKEHGSPDQTRGILLESIFEQAKSNISAAIRQIEILDRELY